MSVQVRCTPVVDGVDVRITNEGDEGVHLLDGERMPYLLRTDDALVVLFGVNPPDPDLDYLGIDIPLTRPLPAGGVEEHRVTLRPLWLRDHYSSERDPVPLHGAVDVRCEVGWGRTPITAERAREMSITSLLEWQRLARSEPVRLRLD
jgi:hypothetical protein